MKVFRYIAAAILSLVVCRSDVFATPIVFDITGQFAIGAALSGTLTIDTTTGMATEVNLSVSAPVSIDITVVSNQGTLFGDAALILDDPSTISSFVLLLPVANLIGYTGGHLCSVNDQTGCNGGGSQLFAATNTELLSGSATPAAVPEPATLIMVGSGVLGIVGRWRRRAAPAESSQPFLG